MRRLRMLPILMLFGATGCQTYAGATLLAVSMELAAPRGFVLPTPVALQERSGARFHGSICRKTLSPPPTVIRLDRIGADGNILSSASSRLSEMGGRGGRCVFYDVTTDWSVGAAEHVHVCAVYSNRPCEVAGLGEAPRASQAA